MLVLLLLLLVLWLPSGLQRACEVRAARHVGMMQLQLLVAWVVCLARLSLSEKRGVQHSVCLDGLLV